MIIEEDKFPFKLDKSDFMSLQNTGNFTDTKSDTKKLINTELVNKNMIQVMDEL